MCGGCLRFEEWSERARLALGFFSRGSKGGSKGPRERERAIERDWHYVDPASASPFQQEDCAGICFSATI